MSDSNDPDRQSTPTFGERHGAGFVAGGCAVLLALLMVLQMAC